MEYVKPIQAKAVSGFLKYRANKNQRLERRVLMCVVFWEQGGGKWYTENTLHIVFH